VGKSRNGLHDNTTLSAGNNITFNQNSQGITINAAGSSGSGWSLTGNSGTTPGTDFLGTTDNQNLELHVNGQRALLLQADSPPNIVMGSASNSIGVFAQGGNTISGGNSNIIGGFQDVDAFIGGGANNAMPSGFVNSSFSAIVAGQFNTNNAVGGTIAGGYANFIDADSGWAFIGGGSNNFIENNNGGIHSGTSYSAIVGGVGNTISAQLGMMFIGGGKANFMQSPQNSMGLDGIPGDACSSIVGGFNNSVAGDTIGVFIGGGSGNVTVSPEFPNVTSCAAIVGGSANSNGSSFTFIGGGEENQIGSFADYSAINAGEENYISNYSGWSFIGGGLGNVIQGLEDEDFFAGPMYAVIGGGQLNSIQSGAANSFIGGGSENEISEDSEDAVIGGGDSNTNSGDDSVIAGGTGNSIQGAEYAAIGGGWLNSASGMYATVPGGTGNSASGDGSFAAGAKAQANGLDSFAWGGGILPVIVSGDHTFVIGGVQAVGIDVSSPKFTLDVNGTINGNNSIQMTDDEGDVAASMNSDGDIVGGDLGITGPITCNSLQCFNNVTVGSLTSMGSGSFAGQLNAGCISAPVCMPSDRNLKENFADIDSRDILRRVSALPIGSWAYKKDASIRHIGPMAQDFYAQFNVGMNDKTIMDIDEGGVALAAIQGLNQELTEKDAEIQELKAKAAQVDSLEKRLAELEATVKQLAAQK
jgi:trimeric autotransporter adhesin